MSFPTDKSGNMMEKTGYKSWWWHMNLPELKFLINCILIGSNSNKHYANAGIGLKVNDLSDTRLWSEMEGACWQEINIYILLRFWVLTVVKQSLSVPHRLLNFYIYSKAINFYYFHFTAFNTRYKLHPFHPRKNKWY
jgi:hypothetical protein